MLNLRRTRLGSPNGALNILLRGRPAIGKSFTRSLSKLGILFENIEIEKGIPKLLTSKRPFLTKNRNSTAVKKFSQCVNLHRVLRNGL